MPRRAAICGWLTGLLVATAAGPALAQPKEKPPGIPDLPKLPNYDKFPPPPKVTGEPKPPDTIPLPAPTPAGTPAGGG